tara:strand:+ start:49 stop:501 length:453 start_codon:yes stop_codon:yes gene_type:complete
MGPIGPLPEKTTKKDTYGTLPSDYKETETKDNSSIDFREGRSRNIGKFVQGLDEEFKRRKQKEEDSDDLLKKMMKAKNLAQQARAGAFKINDDISVMPGYQDPGFQYTIPGSKGFGGLIGTVAGGAIGLANPAIGFATGANVGGSIGGYF